MKDAEKTILARKLRDLRQEKGENTKHRSLTQKDVADMLGVSRQMIGMYENELATPSNYVITKLAKYFDVDIEYLLTDTEIRKKDKNIKIHELGLSDHAIESLYSSELFLKLFGGNNYIANVLNEILENDSECLFRLTDIYLDKNKRIELNTETKKHLRESDSVGSIEIDCDYSLEMAVSAFRSLLLKIAGCDGKQ